MSIDRVESSRVESSIDRVESSIDRVESSIESSHRSIESSHRSIIDRVESSRVESNHRSSRVIDRVESSIESSHRSSRVIDRWRRRDGWTLVTSRDRWIDGHGRGGRASIPSHRARARVSWSFYRGVVTRRGVPLRARARAPTGAEAGRAGERVASAERGRGRRRERRARGGRRETSVGRSVGRSSSRALGRRGVEGSFAHSFGRAVGV